MIKRLFFTLVLLFATIVMSFADEQKNITLDNKDHSKATVETSYGNIIITLNEIDDNNNASIAIELENLDESKTLLLFDKPYSEKMLKKQKPSIRYDKIFGGGKSASLIDKFLSNNKEERIIEHCNFMRYVARIEPSEKIKVATIMNNGLTPFTCRLPLYIAKCNSRNCNKLLLMAKEVIELVISVDAKPNEDYINICKRFGDLQKEISNETFCKNRNHRGPSYDTLVKRYKDKIRILTSDINSLLNSHNYMSSDKSYKLYMKVVHKLEKIDFEELSVPSCSKDKKKQGGSSTCKYCNLSYADIYKRLENYYIDIHNGNKSKTQVLSDAEALYNCAMKHKKHTGNENYKSRITTYYNKLKSL